MRTNIEEIKFYYEFIDMLDKEIELTTYQKEKLRKKYNFYPYFIFRQKEKIKTNLLWRLTIPFYIIYCILFGLIFSSIKWVLTGEGFEKHNSIIYKIYRKWSDKIKIYL